VTDEALLVAASCLGIAAFGLSLPILVLMAYTTIVIFFPPQVRPLYLPPRRRR
jgi:hypothetical protein